MASTRAQQRELETAAYTNGLECAKEELRNATNQNTKNCLEDFIRNMKRTAREVYGINLYEPGEFIPGVSGPND